MRSGKVRRAKLYYLRDRKGKSARISEKIKKSVGIDVAEPIDDTENFNEPVDVESKPQVEPKKKDIKKESALKNKDALPKEKLKKEELKAEKK